MILPLEACVECNDVTSFQQSVINAVTGGASRIELCNDMAVDGLTPEANAIRAAREVFGAQDGLLAMIRPRTGDFCYNRNDIEIMCEQIAMAAQAGADGVVLGLANEGMINEKLLDLLLITAQDCQLSVTFHRAFDEMANKKQALELLIEKRVHRVLTSGAPLSSGVCALQTVQEIVATLAQAKDSIEVVVCGGVNNSNVQVLLDYVFSEQALIEQVKKHEIQMSLHCYSGLRCRGITDYGLVKSIVKKAQQFLVAYPFSTAVKSHY